MSRYRKAAIVGLIALPIVVGGFVIQERGALAGSKLFDQVFAIINERYVDSVDAGTLYEKAARGLVAELKDPYAELYTPKQLEAFNTTTGGFYGGVGMSIEDQQGLITVVKVFAHTPADEAGILVGDKIVAVDSANARGWKVEQVSGKLKGVPGTRVKATFLRSGAADPFTVSFTRRVVRIPAVSTALILENKSAYIKVEGFNETASEEVAMNLQRLVADGAKNLILDLRSNPGGYLEQALTMSNLFIGKGKEVVTVRGRGEPPQTHVTEAVALAPDIPMVILTDGYTASASEIVAGALQDHDRALILGTTSFGKGLVQGMYRLDGGYAIKLTTAKWYTPSGRSIQKERKLTDDGLLIEVHPDSLETDSARKSRPKFKSDAGRIVYGGGAVTPDVIVAYDTLTSPEQKLARALAVKGTEWLLTLDDYALSLKTKVQPDFTITSDMREAFYQRLQKRGVVVDPTVYEAGIRYVDRALVNRIAQFAFGDSTAKRKEYKEDVQLMTALDLLKKGVTQKELFVLASSTAAKPQKHH
jgi:carboxyl-terminal processing protease